MVRSVTAKIADLHKFLVHRDHKLTPLHMACSEGLVTLVFEYVDMGLDVSAQDHSGRSALNYARAFLVGQYLPSRYKALTSGNDDSLEWTRMLVALGEDTAAAHYYISLFISPNLLPSQKRQDRGHIQVGRRWCERTVELPPMPENASSSKIPDIVDFPSLSNTPDQALSLSLATQNVWSPAEMARSVVKHSHAIDVQPPPPSNPTTDPFPSLTKSYEAVSINEPSLMAWTTFREPSTQHDNVAEEALPRSKQGKRRWQPLKL